VWPAGGVPYLHELVAGGRLFNERVRLQRAGPGPAHGNAAQLWGHHFDRFHLVTGFALGTDGCWVPHGWAVGPEGRKGTAYLYETTQRRERYYGYILTHDEAVHLWIRDALWDGGKDPLLAFCDIASLGDLYCLLGPARSGRAGGFAAPARGRDGGAVADEEATATPCPGAERRPWLTRPSRHPGAGMSTSRAGRGCCDGHR
jgi:hypothetical protein